MTTKEVPIPASWPQQKAIWAICRKTNVIGTGDVILEFENIKRWAEDGRLTRKKAHDIIAAFYDREPVKFEELVEEFDITWHVDREKFMNALRRPKKHKSERYTYRKEEEEEKKSRPSQPTPPPIPAAPESKPKLELGQRVKYVGPQDKRKDPYPWLRGSVGTLVTYTSPTVGVEYDPFPAGHRGHSCNGKAKAEHGWNCSENDIEVIQSTEDWPTDDWETSETTYTDSSKPGVPKKEKPKKEEEKKEDPPKEPETFTPVTPEFEKPSIFDDVCLMIKNGVQVLLVGPSGCGKSMMINEIHKVLGTDLYVESFAGGKRYAQVFGSTHLEDGKSKWMTAEFLKAVQKPGIVFMDEVMSADADVLIGCNSLLDRKTRCFHTPEGVVEVHKDCVIVGASNVSGREYSQNYKGTQQQDASILNRFVHVPMTYDKKVEEKIVKKSGISVKDGTNLITWLNELRTKVSLNNIMYDPSTRKLVQAIELIKMGMPANKAFTYAFVTPLSEIEKKKVGTIC